MMIIISPNGSCSSPTKGLRTTSAGQRCSKSKGLTLVEMLIAMVIGIFLMGGVIELFVGNSDSHQLQQGISRAQENGRLALYLISKNLQRAAYPKNSSDDIDGFNRDMIPGADFTPVRVTPYEGDTGTVGDPDAMVFQFQTPSGGINDCIGRNIAALDGAGDETFVASHILLVGDVLTCESITTDPAHIPALRSSTLLSGVTDLQFSYGEDTDSNGEVDGPYVDADAVANWRTVVGVQVQVTVLIEPVSLSGGATRLFSTTVPIRNQINKD